MQLHRLILSYEQSHQSLLFPHRLSKNPGNYKKIKSKFESVCATAQADFEFTVNILLNPIALKTPQSFGHFECSRIKVPFYTTSVICLLHITI